MTHHQLIAAVADRGLTRQEAELAVTAMLDAIQEALYAGDKVNLLNICVLQTRTSPPKRMYAPAQGDFIIVPPKVRVKFTVSTKLHNGLNPKQPK